MPQPSAGGLVKIEPEALAVLPDRFSRNVTQPWQATNIPDSAAVSGTVGQRLNVSQAQFLSFSGKFARILGPDPVLELLAERDFDFAHEGPVHLPDSDEVFFTSNRISDGSSGLSAVRLFAVNITTGSVREIRSQPPVPFANGAVGYNGGIALLAQGYCEEQPGGVLYLDPYSGKWRWLINNWFGLHFNSPNDIVAGEGGELWFTDPTYGSRQGFKGTPQLGEFVWRYVPGGPPARVVADGFERPNGLCFSGDGATLYVSDTGMASGAEGEAPDPLKPHTIYAFDVIKRNGGRFLGNRRVFAVCDTGIPDGLKTDLDGNVYSGCGDGLNVWAACGDLIGKIVVEGGVANFVFAGNELIMLAERRVLKLHLRCRGGCD